MEEYKVNLGEVLKKYRKANRLSQNQVAEMLGMQRSTYAYYETNKSRPTYEALRKIAAFYNVSLEELIFDVSDEAQLNSDSPEYDKGWNEEKYLSELSQFERSVILGVRLMSNENKRELMKFIEEHTPKFGQ